MIYIIVNLIIVKNDIEEGCSMKVTYFGTTTLLFDDGIDQILFDAHMTRPSFMTVGFGKLKTNTDLVDSMILKHDITRLKSIFVSHSHHDHVMDVPYIAKKCNCEIYGSKSTLYVAKGLNIADKKLHEFKCYKEIRIGNYEITVIPSLHSKAHWYNDDLGKTIDVPLIQPAKKKEFKEGGSYDFIIKHSGKTYLIRPSFNHIEGQLDEINADILFLGIAGIAKSSEQEKELFFKETVEKVKPSLIIPIHWDNFFVSLDSPKYMMSKLFDDTEKTLHELMKYCEEKQIAYLVQLPRTFIEI